MSPMCPATHHELLHLEQRGLQRMQFTVMLLLRPLQGLDVLRLLQCLGQPLLLTSPGQDLNLRLQRSARQTCCQMGQASTAMSAAIVSG
jgi:hypothetical protein